MTASLKATYAGSQALQPRGATIGIRPATRADLADIVAMQRLSLRTLGRAHYSDVEIEAYLACTPTTEDYLIEDGTYFVVHVGEFLAGCGGWSMKAPAYSAVTHDAANRQQRRLPKVRAMYVHPGFVRHGIGTRLLAVIETAIVAAGFEDAGLDATLGGVLLYERNGYRRVGQTHAELSNGLRMPFVCMHKRLVERSLAHLVPAP